jgi:hypothetical protein
MIIVILGPGSTRSRKERCMKKVSVEKSAVVEMSAVPQVETQATVVTEVKVRESKQYGISLGKLPEENQKPLGLHGIIITEAITALVNEGKTSSTRDEIMTRACELGLYERKPSRQGVVPIFSWWRKMLKELGWINY